MPGDVSGVGPVQVDITLTVNGQTEQRAVPTPRLLLDFLRVDLDLTGAHSACETGRCGACTVLVNGQATKSCSVLAASCDGDSVLTVEGLAQDGRLHPMQEAFREHHALQCGFCTPGMIMAGIDILRRSNNKPTAARVRHELEGNLCRCTGYDNIVKAILSADDARRQRREPTA